MSVKNMISIYVAHEQSVFISVFINKYNYCHKPTNYFVLCEDSTQHYD